MVVEDRHVADCTGENEASCAFITLSLLFDSEQIDELLRDCEAPVRHWNKDVIKKLKSYAGTTKLRAAINPMFDDIADRERNLFIKDFILDAYDPQDVRKEANDQPDNGDVNVCAIMDLYISGAESKHEATKIRWDTEGCETTLELNDSILFHDVRCRAFWMAHSNDSLSYHLSFEVPYQHQLHDYFGMSLLLKAVFPTEGTAWVLAEGSGWMVQAKGASAKEAESLPGFMKGVFNRHAGHLFDTVFDAVLRNQGHATDRLSRHSAGLAGSIAWNSLVIGDVDISARNDDNGQAGPVFWGDLSQRRLLVVLRDATLFDAIYRKRSADMTKLRLIMPPEPEDGSTRTHKRYSAAGLEKYFSELAEKMGEGARGNTEVYGDGNESLARESRELQQAFFASGFFQNVIDYLEQDGLEIHDGLAPIYPAKNSLESNDGYLFYATQRVIFEVVRSSRSLDGSGREWLGTCPYLFLVHITAFNNECVVHKYEELVTSLVYDLDKLGVNAGSTPRALKAYKRIKKFRIEAFSRVHKHFSFNFFRYETERTVFDESNAYAEQMPVNAIGMTSLTT